MRPYKASNGRVIARGRGGKFRQWTFDDAGIGVCPKCNHITVMPAEPEGLRKDGMVNPFLLNKYRKARICPNKECDYVSPEAKEIGATKLPSPPPPQDVKGFFAKASELMQQGREEDARNGM